MKTLIITGASRGIGLATAQHFLTKDWQVINLSRSACSPPQFKSSVVNVSVDFTSTMQINAAINTLKEKLSATPNQQICLIHNAHHYYSNHSFETDASQMADSLHANLIAPALLNQTVIDHMGKASSLLYVGSTLSHKAIAGAANYIINKHATLGQMRATCQDLIKYPSIHTACICPGFTETELLISHMGNDQSRLEEIKQRVTQQRLITPQEIAKCLYFCATNPVINGAVIDANLGQIEH